MLWPVCLALAGVVTGLAWRLPVLGSADSLAMRRINRMSLPGLIDGALGILRLAGTTPFFLVALVLAGAARPASAISLAVAALVAEVITKGLKLAIRRPRPFESDPGVVVRLPRLPGDPSFPSGDAMRAAFLGGLSLTAAGVPSWGAGLCLLGSSLVALGRVRSGAHYPLDVWAGFLMGLGIALAWAAALGL